MHSTDGAPTERTLSGAGRRFAIATPHVEATAAGLDAFDGGGNAVDAALAAATTLAVVYPHMCGVGGDLFALIHEPDGRTVVLNASGAAPAASDIDSLARQYDAMPVTGPHPVTVPGAVSGWWQLGTRWSDLGFARAFTRAISLARDGAPVARSLADSLTWHREQILADPGLRDVYTRDGETLHAGATLLQRALARTLETIVDVGPEALYGGEIGAAIADQLASLGGVMTIDDLAAHDAELDSPLKLRYRDLDVSVAPPNSQGFVLLQILAAIERLDIDPDPLGADAGTIAEVVRFTGIDRDRHNADPRFARVPVGTLLDEGHLAGIVDQVREPQLREVASSFGDDTIALVAADDRGLAISLIQSLYSGFGSGILEPTTGVVLHNRGAAFSLDTEHPNALAGGKRPAHTLLPVVVEREGRLAAITGTMGGGGQPQIDAMSIVRAFDMGMDAASTVAAPRWLVGGMELGSTERAIVAEGAVPASTREALSGKGYRIGMLEDVSEDVGHAHLIKVEGDGSFDAGSDPRADGGVAVR
jgi:gamma-glutamyltranspeptidase/glutathione hydrolase